MYHTYSVHTLQLAKPYFKITLQKNLVFLLMILWDSCLSKIKARLIKKVSKGVFVDICSLNWYRGIVELQGRTLPTPGPAQGPLIMRVHRAHPESCMFGMTHTMLDKAVSSRCTRHAVGPGYYSLFSFWRLSRTNVYSHTERIITLCITSECITSERLMS
jgi:hypothetical protein